MPSPERPCCAVLTLMYPTKMRCAISRLPCLVCKRAQASVLTEIRAFASASFCSGVATVSSKGVIAAVAATSRCPISAFCPACIVAERAGQARNEAGANRVGDEHKYDRDRPRLALKCSGHRRALTSRPSPKGIPGAKRQTTAALAMIERAEVASKVFGGTFGKPN
jgi:hypothetical protein